jgi:hypothetical protein
MIKDETPLVPIALSIIVGMIWAILMLLYVLLLSSDFYWLQDLAVFGLSLLVAGGVVGLIWVYWIFKR